MIVNCRISFAVVSRLVLLALAQVESGISCTVVSRLVLRFDQIMALASRVWDQVWCSK